MATLADLYVRGKDLEIEGIKIYVQKLNPVEHQTALRRADAARARILAAKYDEDSDTYLSVLNECLSYDKPTLVDVLADAEEARIRPAREAKVAAEDEWSENNYLQGLRDAWSDELMMRFIDEPDDSEAVKVKEALERFLDQVNVEVKDEIDSFKHSLNDMSERELVDSLMAQRIKLAGDQAWIDEYHRNEIAFGVRDSHDHDKLYFANRAAVDKLQAPTILQLTSAFRSLNVDPSEGKGSAVAPPSSDSSEPSEQAEEPALSGPPVAAA